MGTFADRYQDGRTEDVWAELVALGPDVEDPAVREDALYVARLTMERVSLNVATLIVRLTAMGYRFGARFDHNRRRRTIEELGLRDGMASAGRDVSWVDAGDVPETVMGWPGPRPEARALVERAEELAAPLPMSVRMLALFVDRVDLSGSFPSWDPSAYDFDEDDWPAPGASSAALNFLGLDVIEDLVKPGTGAFDPQFCDDQGRVSLPISADHLLAANIPGGYLTVRVPEQVADPLVHGVLGHPEGIRLVEHLREVFAWGGFPGFALASSTPPEIDVLRRDLLPI